MSRLKFFKIRQTRYFYVFTYRNLLNTLIFLIICNLIFLGIATHLYATRGLHTFFATSGYTNPSQLVPYVKPNYASLPLLQDDNLKDINPDINLLR